MKALQATYVTGPHVCSACLGCPASDTRDLGERKRGTEERQRRYSRALLVGARVPRFKSLGSLAARWRARAPGFKSSYWLDGECARMWPMPGPVVDSALRQRRDSPIGGAWRSCIYGVWRGATRPSS